MRIDGMRFFGKYRGPLRLRSGQALDCASLRDAARDDDPNKSQRDLWVVAGMAVARDLGRATIGRACRAGIGAFRLTAAGGHGGCGDSRNRAFGISK